MSVTGVVFSVSLLLNLFHCDNLQWHFSSWSWVFWLRPPTVLCNPNPSPLLVCDVP